MIATAFAGEDEAVAHLLRQMKVIATKEVEKLPLHALESFLFQETPSVCSSQGIEEESFRSDVRKRTVSVESIDSVVSKTPSTKLYSMPLSKAYVPTGPRTSSDHPDFIEHHDWSQHDVFRSKPQLATAKVMAAKKHGKRKAESFVGQTTNSGVVRASLRRKFSWKQYPEVGSSSSWIHLLPCHFSHTLTPWFLLW
jgi:hypothetical protein